MTDESQLKSNNIFFNETGYEKLHDFLAENHFSKIFVLVDSHTQTHCLPLFLPKLETTLEIEIVEMEAGEENKNMETCTGIWNALSELGADRKSLLINLGGGVVTDLGGFVAVCFKRGISFINFPTTLLAMVDAAIGGKTGVNLGNLKNQIGIIKPPALVIVDTSFLKSLPPTEMRSGLAEMLKHGLIQYENYWERLIGFNKLALEDLDGLILESIVIKDNIVSKDPEENHLRKSLNFGHTLGHAIESYFLENPSKEKLLHGEAVAAGMVMAIYLSVEHLSFPEQKSVEISRAIFSIFGKIDLKVEDREKIIELLKFDKKNVGKNINFVLLKNIAEPVMDCLVPNGLLYKVFDYYIDAQ